MYASLVFPLPCMWLTFQAHLLPLVPREAITRQISFLGQLLTSLIALCTEFIATHLVLRNVMVLLITRVVSSGL